MMSGKRKALTWLLCGAAFVSVIAISGCQISAPASLDEQASDPAPTTKPAVAAAQPELAPPRVNIFGEFGGQPSASTRGPGETGFQQHTWIDEGFDGDVAVDPKGKWLVYSSTR